MRSAFDSACWRDSWRESAESDCCCGGALERLPNAPNPPDGLDDEDDEDEDEDDGAYDGDDEDDDLRDENPPENDFDPPDGFDVLNDFDEPNDFDDSGRAAASCATGAIKASAHTIRNSIARDFGMVRFVPKKLE